MTNILDFMEKIAATTLEGPEQLLNLMGEGLSLMG